MVAGGERDDSGKIGVLLGSLAPALDPATPRGRDEAEQVTEARPEVDESLLLEGQVRRYRPTSVDRAI
ncbi:hypothetical protein GCM10010464_48910 [Pseudonocardia yunnanensis]